MTPLIPKHFSPCCFVINIPKGAEGPVKSILLKGRFSKVCLQIPASWQHGTSSTLLCHPRPKSWAESWVSPAIACREVLPPQPKLQLWRSMVGSWGFLASFSITFPQLCLSDHAYLESCGHRHPLELSHTHNATLCSSGTSSTVPWGRLISSLWLEFQFTQFN